MNSNKTYLSQSLAFMVGMANVMGILIINTATTMMAIAALNGQTAIIVKKANVFVMRLEWLIALVLNNAK